MNIQQLLIQTTCFSLFRVLVVSLQLVLSVTLVQNVPTIIGFGQSVILKKLNSFARKLTGLQLDLNFIESFICAKRWELNSLKADLTEATYHLTILSLILLNCKMAN